MPVHVINSVDSFSHDSSEKKKFSCKFSDPRSFVVVYTIVGNLEIAVYVYLISILSTIERRFGFSPKTSVFIVVCNHISAAAIGPFVGYFGSRYNRPALLGIGIFFVSLSCVLFTIPYYIYGASVHFLSNPLLSPANQTKFDLCDKRIEYSEICAEDHVQDISTIIPIILFCLASVVYGVGRSTYHILGVPYLDDSVDKVNFPIYIGIVAEIINKCLRFV
ncbi:Solute carrier organic anion transporter family member 4C1-like protein [Leptotrombidium deliense]|uniref:Solute carrier organic anion transporter family member 4C1-like protein n=1 Tax=Leptotrombidium deliense TaxID=299467 RepID=A0A443SLR6_9ACAR|nr:Solute carrier organic anion transporter family member 4C1-like protein [Leptotrombidium deliense]